MRKPLLAILGGALLLRLVNVVFSIRNPLTYHRGPDEAHHFDMARHYAGLQQAPGELLAFMDPLYPWLLGQFIRLGDAAPLALFLFQSLVDVGTVALVYLIGSALWSRKAGLWGAAAYAISAPAVFYTTTLLKPILVAHFIALWVMLSVRAFHRGTWGA